MKFSVPEMICGHCTAAIETSIMATDSGATVLCDLSDKSVEVSSDLSQDAIGSAIREAGYEPTPIAAG